MTAGAGGSRVGLTHWWVGLHSGMVGCGPTGQGQLVAGPRGLRAGAALLLGGLGFQHNWLCSLMVPGPGWAPCFGELVGSARS